MAAQVLFLLELIYATGGQCLTTLEGKFFTSSCFVKFLNWLILVPLRKVHQKIFFLSMVFESVEFLNVRTEARNCGRQARHILTISEYRHSISK